MTPLRLRADNFRTFDHLDLTFERGLVGILGELRDAPAGADSNGAGKSSILEAIDIALFGRRSLAGFLTRGGVADTMTLELTFEHADATYRVRRSYSARGRGKTVVDFERLIPDDVYPAGAIVEVDLSTMRAGRGWEPLTCESSKATDALICQTIGLSRDTFRNSSYLRQGDGSYADPARDPKQRKDLLAEAVLGRDPVWPLLQDAAHADRRTAEQELQKLAGETEQARTVFATKRDVELDHTETLAAEKEAAADLAAAEVQVAAVEDRYRVARDLAQARVAAEAEARAAAASLEQLREGEARVVEASKQLTVAREEIATLATAPQTNHLVERERALIAEIADHEKAAAAHQQAARENLRIDDARTRLHLQAADQLASADSFRAKIATLRQQPDATCETCKQHLNDASRAAAIQSYEARIGEHEAETLKLRREAETMTAINVPPAPEDDPPTAALKTVRAQLSAAQQAQQQRVRLEERIQNCETAITAEPDLADRIALAVALAAAKRAAVEDLEPVDVQSIEKAGALCRANVTAARAAVEQKRIELARLDEKIKAVLAAEQQLANAAARATDLHAEVELTVALERACGRDGIPALILENSAIPYLEVEASRILAALGKPYQIELRTQAALKSGDGLKDTLEVVLIDQNGEQHFDDFSKGEQSRIGMALKISLATLMATRRGAESKMLAVDEPMFLDKSGMEALLEVLHDLLARGVFDQIVVVSHFAELRDSIENTFTVINDGGRSRVDGSPVREAVAA